MPDAGWYVDAKDPAKARWYDGQSWTEHRVVAADQDGPPPPPVMPTEPWRGPLLAAVAAGVVAIACLLALRATSGGDDQRISGSFVLVDHTSISHSADGCSGTDGYSDFGPNMRVTIRNGDGRILGSTSTEPSTFVNASGAGLDPGSIAAAGGSGDCVVIWSTTVPAHEKSYEIEIGRRAKLSFSRQQLVDHSWLSNTTLG